MRQIMAKQTTVVNTAMELSSFTTEDPFQRIPQYNALLSRRFYDDWLTV